MCLGWPSAAPSCLTIFHVAEFPPRSAGGSSGDVDGLPAWPPAAAGGLWPTVSHRTKAGVLRDIVGRADTRSVLAAALCSDAIVFVCREQRECIHSTNAQVVASPQMGRSDPLLLATWALASSLKTSPSRHHYPRTYTAAMVSTLVPPKVRRYTVCAGCGC